MYDLYDTEDEDDVNDVDNFMDSIRHVSVSILSRDKFQSHEIILDTAAGESIFKDIDNFDNLGYGEPIFVDGVNKIGAPLLVDTVGDTTFGQAYYSEECSGNILSFANVVDDAASVVYDKARDVFIIQMTEDGDIYEFHRDPQRRIYICDKRSKFRANVWVTTVAQQAAKYTKREVDRAWKAIEYIRKLGFTAGQLIKHLRAGKIKNAEVTPHDVVRSLDIFGKELSNLKGKSTARKLKKEYFEPLPCNPELQKDQELNLDLMFVNNDIYVVGVITPLDYTSVKKVKSKSNSELWKATQRIKMPVERAGLKIAILRCDGESAINSDYMEEKLSNARIFLDTTAQGDAVANVERRIRTIKERVRGIYNTLPFMLCGSLLRWLIQYAVYRINSELKATANDNLSPAERLFNRAIDAKSDLKFAFGDYVQVTDEETTNEMTERTKGAIALMPAGNREGSWWFYILQTGGVVKRNKADKLPMPDEVISILNTIALSEKNNANKTNDAIHIGIWNSAYADGNINNFDDIDEDPIIQEYVPEFIQPNYDENGEEQHSEDGDQPLNFDHDDGNIVMDRHELIDDIFGPDEVFENINYRGDNEDQGVDINDLRNDDLIDDVIQNIEEEKINDDVPERRYNLRPNRAQSGRWSTVKLAAKAEREKYIKTRRELLRRTYGFNMTIKDGIEKLGYDAILSIVQEIMALYNMKTFEGKDVTKFSEEELKRVITSKTFLKEKFSPENIFIKLKSRLVARELNHDMYENGVQRSPTACTESVFIIAAIAAMEKRAVANIDFPSAFLLADIPEDAPEVLVELNKFETRVLCKIDPSYKKFVLKNGKCVVKLKKPLYGTVMAARLWYEKLSGDLLSLGFEKNIQDECVFNRVVNGKQQTLVIHVDDMLITAESENAIDNIIKEIGEKYENLSIYRGRKLDYLGMTFDFTESQKVKITMNGYIQDLLLYCQDMEGTAKTPAANDLFDIDENSEQLDEKKRQNFHSIVAKLLYLSKRVRPDLLTAISFLSKRVKSATVQDMKKLQRVIRYLRGTSTLGIILQANNYVCIYAYVDASYGVHSNLRSQTGCIIGLGCGPVYCKSTAQKINTKSSTEAELVSLSDMTGQVIWTRNFLLGQGYKVPPATIYQDNMSTIALVRNGKSNNSRTRHIAIRYFFVADKVKNGEVAIEYLPTGHMIADILTKPLQGEQFVKLRNQLLNWNE